MSGTRTEVVKGLVGWEEMCGAFDRAIAQVVGLLRELPPEAGERPVPGMEWTVAETAVHLVGILGRGLGDMRRGETLAGLHELNAQCIAEIDTRDLREIADRLEADAARGRPARAGARGDEPFPLHVGVVAEVSAALSYGLWDFLVHGFDIANACGLAWPMPAEDAARALRAGLPAVRPWVRPAVLDGPPRRLTVAFAPSGQALELTVGDGHYAVIPAELEHEQHLTDPVEALLAVNRRVGSADPLVQRLAGWFEPI